MLAPRPNRVAASHAGPVGEGWIRVRTASDGAVTHRDSLGNGGLDLEKETDVASVACLLARIGEADLMQAA